MDVAEITALAGAIAVVLRAVTELVKALRARRATRCTHQLDTEPV